MVHNLKDESKLTWGKWKEIISWRNKHRACEEEIGTCLSLLFKYEWARGDLGMMSRHQIIATLQKHLNAIIRQRDIAKVQGKGLYNQTYHLGRCFWVSGRK